jgi:hypothetical protein
MKNKDFKKTDKEIEKHFKESMKNILSGIDKCKENKK